MRPRNLVIGCLLLANAGGGFQSTAPVVVHEWGTITTVHRPDGTPIGRLNRIARADVLPSFVHRYEPRVTRGDSSKWLGKGPMIPGRPDVTMRLETPVIYFYPPAGSRVRKFDVEVKFRGGVVNEFYPNAEGSIAVDHERVARKMNLGIIRAWDGKVLDNYVLGGLHWKGIELRDTVRLPRTSDPVWLAPRNVKATAVATAGEGERYLFYRGVAHLDALLQTRTLSNTVVLRSPARMLWLEGESTTIAKVWVLDVSANGFIAYVERANLTLDKSRPGAELARVRRFITSDYSTSRRAELRTSMKRALTDGGLFDDEAEAMLETWRDSYFRTPGLRVLYIVPAEWTSYHLPLRISTPHTLTRVLVGRIDLNG
jgi:hypothetical protein